MMTTSSLDHFDARIANLDMGGTAPDLTGGTIVAPMPQVARITGAVDVEAAARCEADEVLVRAAGFAPKRPIYVIGTTVNEVGVENFRASRGDFERMPLAVEAIGKLQELVAGERRENIPVTIGELEMNGDGTLSTPAGRLPMSEAAFEHFAYGIAPHGGKYLSLCPSPLRAENFNYWKEQGGTSARKAQLRVRDGKGGREIFAAVGPRYAAHDVDVLAGQVVEALPAGARAEINYDGARARISVLFHSNIKPEQCAAGEFFKAGVNITADDTGNGSIKADGEVWRNLCLNLIIIDRAKAQYGRRRHVGKTTIGGDVEVLVAKAMDAVSGFASKWNEATVENVVERYEADGPEAVFRGLVFNKLVWAPGVGAEGMIERLQRAWDQEPGYSKSAFVNAITRAAHAEPWASPWVTEDLERAAGQLLYAKVWNVQLPEELV